jgi:hypothetical protein
VKTLRQLLASENWPNIDQNLRGPGKHVGYSAGDVWHIQKSNGPRSNWYSGVRRSNGDVISGKGLGAISQKLQAKDREFRAAAEAARRKKSEVRES